MSAIQPREAALRMVQAARALDAERVPLAEARGRVLAADVVSPVDLPPWDNASMDGYAVRATDVAGATHDAPRVLTVIGTIAAGAHGHRALQPGEAYRIMTGAPVPTGADSVVRVEDTDAGAERVCVMDARDGGRNVRPRGEDLARERLAVAAGTGLTAAHVGVLASAGCAQVPVTRRPRVGILTTGDELVNVEEMARVLAGDRIVNSNRYALEAAVANAGADAVFLGLAPDNPAALRSALESAPPLDLLLTTGGVSVGLFDHTRDVLRELGATLEFWRVRIRPGAPLTFGTWRDTPWVGLPGNPVSGMVTFELFVRPVLRRMLGMPQVFPRGVAVRVLERINADAPLTHFFRAIVSAEADGQLCARLTGPQGSGLLTSVAAANALLVVPPEVSTIQAGDACTALLLDSDSLLGDTPAF